MRLQSREPIELGGKKCARRSIEMDGASRPTWLLRSGNRCIYEFALKRSPAEVLWVPRHLAQILDPSFHRAVKACASAAAYPDTSKGSMLSLRGTRTSSADVLRHIKLFNVLGKAFGKARRR